MNENARCCACAGPLAFLGQLGRLLWFRCIHCGLDQSWQQKIEEESMPVPVHKASPDIKRTAIENTARQCAASVVHQNEFLWTHDAERGTEAQA